MKERFSDFETCSSSISKLKARVHTLAAGLIKAIQVCESIQPLVALKSDVEWDAIYSEWVSWAPSEQANKPVLQHVLQFAKGHCDINEASFIETSRAAEPQNVPSRL